MSENVGKFTWSKKSSRAAQLVADDQLTNVEIAAQVGITDRTLNRWKLDPQFQARVEEIVEKKRESLLKKSIADSDRRQDALIQLFDKAQKVIEARANEHKNVPGGDTGLLVRDVRLVKVYESSESAPPENPEDEDLYFAKRTVTVEVYAVDTALLKEMRELMKHIAIERGEWTEKTSMSVTPVKGYVGFDPEEV